MTERRTLTRAGAIAVDAILAACPRRSAPATSSGRR
jgi:hypothetical protein